MVKNEDCKISVLMSIYNGEEFIEDQLDSIRMQSYKADEVILIDDCSTDNTINVVKRYIIKHQLDNTWKLINNKTNHGWKYNFIFGLKYVRGSIVFFSDQDDIWFKNKIEIYKNIFDNNNNEINVIASKETKWDGSKEIDDLRIKNGSYKRITFNKDNFFIKCSGCTMAVRMDYINSVIKFYRNDWAHDDFFWKMGTLDGSLVLLNSSSILHRIHGTNESLKRRNRKTTLETICLNKNIISSMEQRLSSDDFPSNHGVKQQVLMHKEKGNLEREKLFKSRNVFYIVPLFVKYRDMYRRPKQLLGDLVYAIWG